MQAVIKRCSRWLSRKAVIKKVSAHGRSLWEWCKCVREGKSPIDHGYLSCLSAPGKVKWSCMDVQVYFSS
jgi:hypothetical protein